MNLKYFLLAGILAFLACATISKPAAQVCTSVKQNLETALEERLKPMPDVAKWKWCHKKPVFDAAREEQVLNDATQKGAQRGLSESVVRDFFQKQMDQAKAIQSKVIDGLKEDPIDCSLYSTDGLNQIREQISRNTEHILKNLEVLNKMKCLDSIQQDL